MYEALWFRKLPSHSQNHILLQGVTQTSHGNPLLAQDCLQRAPETLPHGVHPTTGRSLMGLFWHPHSTVMESTRDTQGLFGPFLCIPQLEMGLGLKLGSWEVPPRQLEN